eukprot:CAMPEP_0180474890 /NCGR_PEP_ID=MMETSP1036_2-20121128/30913_1 /TAXON_ID=632150 /ORGANISM="Azadinium spinosum, Strain 3D9" /LENGTH=41 /DNA_ID= /DNA_START= /DNA_END= /DNA_ORIENTATION=
MPATTSRHLTTSPCIRFAARKSNSKPKNMPNGASVNCGAML